MLEVDGVTDATAKENDTNVTDANGLVAKSFRIMVEGGVDADIAQVIYAKKPIGIATNGTTTVNVADIQGITHPIKFQRPASVTIYVQVTLQPGTSYAGDAAVKQAIVDYADGDLIDGRGFGVGDDVVYSEMFVPVNDTTLGIEQTTEILIGATSPATGTTTISIDDDEKASFVIGNITIVQV